MELRQLRHFIAVAEEMHFGRAAERQFISQAALSASILRLERGFGIRLFDRDTKKVRLTPGGERMLALAREMINQADRTQSVSRALAEGRMGRIEVGFSGAVLQCGLDKVITDCRGPHPDIEILMREIPSPRQAELIRAGRLDAGLVNFPMPPAGLERIELFEDRYGVCLPSAHPLAWQPSIGIAQLQHEPFVMASRDSAPSFYDQLVGLCTNGGFYPRIAFETGHLLSTLHLVAAGGGVALLPLSMVALRMPGLVFVPLKGAQPARSSCFVWDAARVAPGLQVLIDAVRAFAARQAAG
ncbi:LysR family transcriptional regulator [Pseudorhodoferax sp.]|uniref:LysR family transcriptional regulator n=1 Tax=Pseudorhodoferax sp. TaxID=1993553 RepID=UPI002DD631D2|nr:LysR family transcriptional regulator [Pseudorhodoferax sp.]